MKRVFNKENVIILVFIGLMVNFTSKHNRQAFKLMKLNMAIRLKPSLFLMAFLKRLNGKLAIRQGALIGKMYAIF